MRTILLLAGAVSIFRNPFAFRNAAVPAAGRAASRRPAVAETAPSQPARTPELPTICILRKPVTDWRYIGSFGPESDRLAVFAKNGDLLVVRAGDAVDGHVVHAVRPESVELTDDGEIRPVPLGR